MPAASNDKSFGFRYSTVVAAELDIPSELTSMTTLLRVVNDFDTSGHGICEGISFEFERFC